MRDPSVVHQDVDTLLGEHLLECFPHLPLVRDIAGVDARLAAGIGDLLGGRFCLLRADIRDSNGRAIGRETQGDGLPNAAAATRNDGHFAIQAEIAGAAT